MHGHYLDAMGPFLKYFPDAVGNVISKLFEMLTSLPHIVKVCFCFCVEIYPWTYGHVYDIHCLVLKSN